MELTKTWEVQCKTCGGWQDDKVWTVKTQSQANQLKAIHMTSNEGHVVGVVYNG